MDRNRRAGSRVVTTVRSVLALVWVASLGTLALGCASSNTGAGTETADAGVEASSSSNSSCAKDPRTQVYTANMSQMGQSGAVKVVLVASDVAPPARGTNTWTLTVTAADGSALTAPTVDVKPFMPDHGHGTSIKATATMGSDGKTFTVAPLYFFMPGLWQTTFTVKSGTMTDTAVFSFCVEG